VAASPKRLLLANVITTKIPQQAMTGGNIVKVAPEKEAWPLDFFPWSQYRIYHKKFKKVEKNGTKSPKSVVPLDLLGDNLRTKNNEIFLHGLVNDLVWKQMQIVPKVINVV
jgi:hypothetical protein